MPDLHDFGETAEEKTKLRDIGIDTDGTDSSITEASFTDLATPASFTVPTGNFIVCSIFGTSGGASSILTAEIRIDTVQQETVTIQSGTSIGKNFEVLRNDTGSDVTVDVRAYRSTGSDTCQIDYVYMAYGPLLLNGGSFHSNEQKHLEKLKIALTDGNVAVDDNLFPVASTTTKTINKLYDGMPSLSQYNRKVATLGVWDWTGLYYRGD